MKKILRKAYIVISKLIIPFFYDEKYLKERCFYNNIEGWKWCWKSIIYQKAIGINRHVPFPESHNSVVGKVKNIHFDINDLNNFQHFGCYFQDLNG